MLNIKALISRIFGKKEFVLTRSVDEINPVSEKVKKEDWLVKSVEALFETSLSKFPGFNNDGVILDGLFEKDGYKLHAAFSTSENLDPVFITFDIDNIDDCLLPSFTQSVCDIFLEKMIEAQKKLNEAECIYDSPGQISS